MRYSASPTASPVADEESTVIRPVKELQGFEKVELAPGETKTVSMKLIMVLRKKPPFHPLKYPRRWYSNGISFELPLWIPRINAGKAEFLCKIKEKYCKKCRKLSTNVGRYYLHIVLECI